MQKEAKENYYPDRTYKNSARNGTIKISRKKENGAFDELEPKRKHGKCIIKALFSSRWTINGATIVVARQEETTEKSYILAKQLQAEMIEELIENNRFIDDFDGFCAWFSEKEKVLKDNNFRKLKG